MPNYCDNVLRIYGEEESLKKIMEEITTKDEEQRNIIDFNKIVKPPFNVFQGNVNEEIIQALEAYININNINKQEDIEKILNDDAWFKLENDELSFINMAKDEFVELYSEKEYERKIKIISWYDWNVQNWGTKWNAEDYNGGSVENNELSFAFMTAWAPPLGIYETLIEKYEDNEDYGDIKIEYEYYEPGVGFVGDRYEQIDSENTEEYINKVLELDLEECSEVLGFIYDSDKEEYREMTEEETDYFEEHETMEGFEEK